MLEEKENKTLIEVDRKELCIILDVGIDKIKRLVKNNKLENYIDNCGKGYKYVGRYNIGKKIIYQLEYIDVNMWEQLQEYYRINKKYEHTIYSKQRIETGLSMPRTKIIRDNEIDISGDTAKRYDDILINEKAIEFDKEVYMIIDNNEGTMTEITEQEYKNYWKDNRVAQMALSNVRLKRYRQEITEDFADYSTYDIMENLGTKEGTIAIKFGTYKQAENAKLILDMINKHIRK